MMRDSSLIADLTIIRKNDNLCENSLEKIHPEKLLTLEKIECNITFAILL
jgi:hypothetical protein